MQLLGGPGVLLVALAIYFLNMADGNRSRTADPLEIQLNSLRQDFNSIRLKLEVEIEDRRNERENLQEKIFELQDMVNELKPTNIQTKMLHRIYEGLSTEKQLRQQTQNDLMQLKTQVRGYSDKIASLQAAAVHNHTTQADGLSDLQIQTARLKCDPCCMPGLPGQEGETDRCGENGTRPERVSVPELRFTRADGYKPERAVIEAGGAAVRDGPRRAVSTTVRTDGLFGADRRLYWETRLDWSQVSVPSYSWWWVGGVGVRREGSHFDTWPGDDDQSWGVRIVYNHSQKRWRYYCVHGGKVVFKSPAVTATSPSISLRLGLLLDPGAGTLTAVDVNTNSPIYTFSLPAGDAGSQPLVPVVWFGWEYFERRFSLAGVGPSRLPGAVTDLLQK